MIDSRTGKINENKISKFVSRQFLNSYQSILLLIIHFASSRQVAVTRLTTRFSLANKCASRNVCAPSDIATQETVVIVVLVVQL